MDTKKILVIGDSESGKRTALQHICKHLVITESASYGKTEVNNQKIQIFILSGSQRFGFIKDILSKKMDGAIVFIDNTRGMTPKSIEMINFVEEEKIPYVIFSNKQDLNNSDLETEAIDIPIIPTVAITGEGVDHGFEELLKIMDPSIKEIEALCE